MADSSLPIRVLSTLTVAAAVTSTLGCTEPEPVQVIIYPDSSTGDTSAEEDSSGDESSAGEDSTGDESSGGDEPDPACTPTGYESCNGVDDDCDGEVDEICPGQAQYVVLTNDYLGVSRALGTNEPFGFPTVLLSEGGLETMWQMQAAADGYYRLFPALFVGEYALDSDTERPVIAPTGKYSGQYWAVEEVPEGCVRLTNMFQGPGRALDTDADGNAFLGGNEETAGQCWTIHIVEGPRPK